MPPVFQPRANLIARGSLFSLAGASVGAVALWIGLTGSSYDTGQTLALWQPVPFSHAHHTGELGIDCRYCHESVETAPAAGMPSTDVCMNCHAELWTDADVLEPVRASWREGRRLRWKRVYELPDFVFFDHSVHVTAGVSCRVCHGDVDRMPLVREALSHTMRWCLDCHRDPGPRLHERSLFTSPVPELPGDAAVREVRTDGLTSCSTCHR